MAGRKRTLEEHIQAARERLEDGKRFSELSETYGTTVQVIRNWVKRHQEMGAAGLEDHRRKNVLRTGHSGHRKRHCGPSVTVGLFTMFSGTPTTVPWSMRHWIRPWLLTQMPMEVYAQCRIV